MKKIFLSICLFIGAPTVFQSCVYVESDDNIPPRGESTRTYDFKNFDELEMGDAFKVRVNWGSSYAVSATGELNDLDDLHIFVQDGKLVARYDSWRNRRKPMTIDITMPDIESVNFSGAVDASLVDFENIPGLELELSGATRCSFEGSAREIKFEVSGASRLNLSGSAKFMDGELTGASQLNSLELPAEESDLDVSGASAARVWVTKLFEVDASGASKVTYKGSPKVEKKVSGGSTVRTE